MDDLAQEILARFEARADAIAEEIATCTVNEVPGFAAVNDGFLHAEIRMLARRHLDAFLHTVRTGGPPSAAILGDARERAVLRAREMVPLSAQVQSYLIAQRVISAAIAREADPDARSREAALTLTARTFDYNIAVTAAMAEAYLEVVQGDLAELDSARRSLIDALLRGEPEQHPALARHAAGLGFDPGRELVAVVAVVVNDRSGALTRTPRWASQAIARCSERPERSAFVVGRERDLVALLDVGADHDARRVLERAAAAVRGLGASLHAGVGTPFTGLDGFATSYHEARRALRHASTGRPLVFGPRDVPLFDELTSLGRDDASSLIPEATREILRDDATRQTIEAFFAADLQVSVAAKTLSLHPNSLRYRLGRIATQTGRDPRKLADLLELITAARLTSNGVAATPPRGARRS
jgi:GGDEF-like domain/PucR C-terminal helix-turn-helix domain